MTGRELAKRDGQAPAELVGRILSTGRFWIAESKRGELVIAWQPEDGKPAGEFRLPRTLTVLVRRAAAGEDIAPHAVIAALAKLGGRHG